MPRKCDTIQKDRSQMKASIIVSHLPTVEENRNRDSYGALRFHDFRLLLGSVFLMMFGQQMLTVALGWELYNRTGSALVLGGIGLAQVIPLILLFLPARICRRQHQSQIHSYRHSDTLTPGRAWFSSTFLSTWPSALGLRLPHTTRCGSIL